MKCIQNLNNRVIRKKIPSGQRIVLIQLTNLTNTYLIGGERKCRVVKIVLLTVLVFCSVAAYAEEQYRAEVSANYIRIDERDESYDSRLFLYGVSGELFFAPVKTAEHPYAEAAFLERIGSAFVSVLDQEMKGAMEGDGRSLAANINYTRPGFPLAIKAMYAKLKFDFDGAADTKSKGNFYSLSVGNYFTRTLLAGVEYSYLKGESSSLFSPTFTSKSKDYGIFAKYVHELEHGRGLNFEGSLGTTKSDDGTETLSNTNVALAVDYFFNRSVSAGVGIENNSGDDKDFEGITYLANIRYFITPRLSVKATYDRFENANAGLYDEESFGARLAARF